MIFAACAILLIGCLFYMFVPASLPFGGAEKTRLQYLEERREAIYENLRDLKFEYKAGKFTDADYEAMSNSLELEAAKVLAEIASHSRE